MSTVWVDDIKVGYGNKNACRALCRELRRSPRKDVVMDYRFKSMNTFQIYEELLKECNEDQDSGDDGTIRLVIEDQQSGQYEPGEGSAGGSDDEDEDDEDQDEDDGNAAGDSSGDKDGEDQGDEKGSGSGQGDEDQDDEDGSTDGSGDKDSEDQDQDDDCGKDSYGKYGTFKDYTHDPDSDETDDEQARAEEDRKVTQQIISSIHDMKLAGGHVPETFVRMIDEILYPEIDYKELLKNIVEDIMASDYSWERLDQAYMQRNILVPSLARREITEIIIAVDTSMSISQDEYNTYICDAAYVIESYPDAVIHIMGCDTTVGEKRYTLQAGEMLTEEKYDLGGGGGTYFKPVFDFIEDEGLMPTLLMYYTDGWNGDSGRLEEMGEPSYPVIWISTDKEEDSFPFGRVIMHSRE